MSEIKLDDGIPVPPKRSSYRYPAREMNVGQSFFAPQDSNRSAVMLAGYFNKLLRPKKFTGRKKVESGITGYRIWRIE